METPTYFELVRHAFERVYAELPNGTRDQRIKDALDGMSARYRSVLVSGGPDFSDEYTRAAYLFRYVAAHADMVSDVITNCPELRALLAREKVQVTSLGGGPGTDVLAIARHAITSKLPSRFYFNLVDREGAWAATWADVDMVLSDHFHSSRTFFDVDVLVENSWKFRKVIFKANLITCSWFLSEIMKDLEHALPFFAAMLNDAPSGTHFLFVDFDHTTVASYISKIATAGGLQEVYSVGYDFQISPREQKSVLKDFIERFHAGPKLTGKVLARIYRKP